MPELVNFVRQCGGHSWVALGLNALQFSIVGTRLSYPMCSSCWYHSNGTSPTVFFGGRSSSDESEPSSAINASSLSKEDAGTRLDKGNWRPCRTGCSAPCVLPLLPSALPPLTASSATLPPTTAPSSSSPSTSEPTCASRSTGGEPAPAAPRGPPDSSPAVVPGRWALVVAIKASRPAEYKGMVERSVAAEHGV